MESISEITISLREEQGVSVKPAQPGGAVVVRNARRLDKHRRESFLARCFRRCRQWLRTKRPLTKRQLIRQLEAALDRQCLPHITGILMLSLSRSDSIDAILEQPDAQTLQSRIVDRVQRSLRQEDRLCLISHDEIWILLEDLPSAAVASLAAHRLATELQTPVLTKGAVATVHPCIGVAVAKERGADFRSLLAAAAQARNRAHALGQPYCTATASDYGRRVSADLVHAVEYALKHNALSLVYQPKVSLRTGSAASVEALIRWPDALKPAVTTKALISIAEEFGMMHELTRYVLHTVLREHAADLGPAGITKVWINLSARMLADPDLDTFLMQAMDVWSASPDMLGLEITESMLILDIEQSVRMLNRLSSLGFSLAIDDFGTGYSSLAYLRRLPINELKIDQLFVRYLATSVPDEEIVRAIIDLAHHFKLDVVAEGVEDCATLALLEKMGCDKVQGWVFAKGMRAIEVAAWCRGTVPNRRIAAAGQR